jgi:transcriptional regulator with XRE-family HTH domain
MGTRKRPVPARLAEKLLKIRKHLDLSQEQLAERLSHLPSPPHAGHISRFEAGTREPSLIYLLEISRLSGATLESLLDDEQELDLSGKGGRKKAK